ncbi:hypothetical protein [Mycoplasma sp. Ms02]|uniref:hypothetical protein n=1 Tax=Mycoplasma sp. Ms02 TaxID=353851 RepID=UPI001C898E92|nr:hypothetical protein [Mycoplasma sp. Ms02]QZE12211.1 hypothetical protein K4L35_02605 [Mycoplasma sp. Ms02]
MKLNKLLLVVGASSVVTLATGLAANCAPAQEQPKNPEINKGVTPAKDASDNQNTAENTNADANNQNASDNTNSDANNQNASDNANSDANNQNSSENTEADTNKDNASDNTNADANNQNASDNTNADANNQNASDNTNAVANNQNASDNTNADANNQNASENSEEQPKEPVVEPAKPATLREKAEGLVKEADKLLKEYPRSGTTALIYNAVSNFIFESRKLRKVLEDENASDEVIQPVFDSASKLSREFQEALPALLAKQKLASLGQVLRALVGLSPYVDNPDAFYTTKLKELAEEVVLSSTDKLIDTKELAEELLSKYETKRELIAALADLQALIKTADRLSQETNDLENEKAELQKAIQESNNLLLNEAQATYGSDFDFLSKEREVRQSIQNLQNKINLLRNVGGNNATGAIIPQVAISAREAVLEMVKLSRKLIERVEISVGNSATVPSAAQETLAKLKEYTDKHEKAALDFAYTNGGYRRALFNDAGVNVQSYSETSETGLRNQESLMFWFVRLVEDVKNDVKVTWNDMTFLRSILEQTVASLNARSEFYDELSKDRLSLPDEKKRWESRKALVDRHIANLALILSRSETSPTTASLMTVKTLWVDFHREFSMLSVAVNPRTFLSSTNGQGSDPLFQKKTLKPASWKASRIPSFLLGNINENEEGAIKRYKEVIKPVEDKIEELQAKVEKITDQTQKGNLQEVLTNYLWQTGGNAKGTKGWTPTSVKYSIIRYEGQAQDFLKALERKEKEIDALLAAQPAAETQEEAPAQA